MGIVTRVAALKYKTGTTDEQKRQTLDGLVQLAHDFEHLLNRGLVGKYIQIKSHNVCSQLMVFDTK